MSPNWNEIQYQGARLRDYIVGESYNVTVAIALKTFSHLQVNVSPWLGTICRTCWAACTHTAASSRPVSHWWNRLSQRYCDDTGWHSVVSWSGDNGRCEAFCLRPAQQWAPADLVVSPVENKKVTQFLRCDERLQCLTYAVTLETESRVSTSNAQEQPLLTKQHLQSVG